MLRNILISANLLKFSVRGYSSKIPKNALENVISAQHQKENGVVYDKKPFKIALVEGKSYLWCLCGRSHNQPFCDGTHKNQQLRVTQKPIRFQVEESKDYWLCNCKQTANRPFCDGTHKTDDVINATSLVRQ
ncbi:CDGSH iron-sulfur domain-containing protein 3, mitochondrial [Coccinella septempunctata]|uniref:CDGSH iron-sulfur domain-containing protein 3, mitochondrial n=1 Tax=Coccinella septempunctata TaxID=41139 RepID=UPI001D0902C3|nr:CDGSH iron-sulfur domain-containing protein 3, mitochondrial [Coccinella septempunctata]